MAEGPEGVQRCDGRKHREQDRRGCAFADKTVRPVVNWWCGQALSGWAKQIAEQLASTQGVHSGNKRWVWRRVGGGG